MRHVSSGQMVRRSAREQNAMADLLTQANDRRGLGDSFRGGPELICKIKNDTTARKLGEVLGLGDPVHEFDPTETRIGPQMLVVGVTPEMPTHLGRYAVLLNSVDQYGIATACLSGVCKAWVNVTNEAHWFAEIDDDEVKLISRETGSAQILAKASGTGMRLCWVRVGLPVVKQHHAQLTEPLPYGETAAANLFDGHGGFREIQVVCRLLDEGRRLPDESLLEVVPLPDQDYWVAIWSSDCDEAIPDPPPEE